MLQQDEVIGKCNHAIKTVKDVDTWRKDTENNR